jgi:bacterioferritin-associated ferredoxin
MAIVCHCHVVSDRHVEEVVFGGACSLDEVADNCGAGARCGGCVPAIEALLDRLQARLDGAAA